MFTLLISIIIVLAVLLVLVILAQDSKGGVGAAFGGSASQIMGVTKTGNILEKSTWVLSIAILVLSLTSSAFYSKENGGDFSSPNIESAKKQVINPTFGDVESLLPSSSDDSSAQEEGEGNTENE
ncbi:preprotein translocase subunit SecG [Cecembia rubra]|uniref:Protein-export membrane protein SecG n=1 Tax=Cecembia rubra TaxID=1485585 RepID=A0A2P8EEH5_9BACT|nr:preprotein translocase subunit SecG [Cecembia rubra]PSL07876.1 preprotein translocase subunit SecG [Cecembia rubra]